jgi:hypothetical protein
MFHQPHRTDQVPPGGGYVSNDGHLFTCRNPTVLQQAFHVYEAFRLFTTFLTDLRV